MNDTLNDILSNPAYQAGIGLLTKTHPHIGLALQFASLLLQQRHEEHEIKAAIAVIDKQAAMHVRRLATEKLHSVEQSEIEIRLHELLVVLVKLGGL